MGHDPPVWEPLTLHDPILSGPAGIETCVLLLDTAKKCCNELEPSYECCWLSCHPTEQVSQQERWIHALPQPLYHHVMSPSLPSFGIHQIPPFLAALYPLSLLGSEIASLRLRTPIAESDTYSGIRGFKSPFTSENYWSIPHPIALHRVPIFCVVASLAVCVCGGDRIGLLLFKMYDKRLRVVAFWFYVFHSLFYFSTSIP